MQFPAFPGMVKHLSQQQIAQFVATMQKAGLDPVAVATVIESESARTWSPSVHGPKVFSESPGYPVGLIQFAPSTARALGTTSAQLEKMSFAQQLPYVVKFFRNAGGGARLARLVDYYLAGWGSGVGSAMSHVLAVAGDATYEANKALDQNKDGQITTEDLNSWVTGLLNGAKSHGYVTVVAVAAGVEWLFWGAVGLFILRRKMKGSHGRY